MNSSKKIKIAIAILTLMIAANVAVATEIGGQNRALGISTVNIRRGGSQEVSLLSPRGTGFTAFKNIVPGCINATSYSNQNGCYAWIGLGGVDRTFVGVVSLPRGFTADPGTLQPVTWGQNFTVKADPNMVAGKYTGSIQYEAGLWKNGNPPEVEDIFIGSLPFDLYVTGEGGLTSGCPTGLVPDPNSNLCIISNIYKEVPSNLAVETLDAKEITDTAAVLVGQGGADLSIVPKLKTTGYFRYSRAEKPPVFCNDLYGTNMRATEDHDLGKDGGMVTFSSRITNLSPGTTYYYCAIVSNSNHIQYGGEKIVKSFRTLPCQTCDQTTVQTKEARPSSDSSYVKGSFSSTKTVTTYFQYRKAPPPLSENLSEGDRELIELRNPWITTEKVAHSVTSSRTQTYSSIYNTIDKLSPETIYLYRAVAENKSSDFGLVLQKCPSNMSYEPTRDVCIVYGETLSFLTKRANDDSAGWADCKQYGTCTCGTGELYDENEKECVNIDIYCSTHLGSSVCASRGPDLSASAVYAGAASVNQPISMRAVISNGGSVQAGGSGQLIHSFQINDSEKEYQDGTTKVINIAGPGIAAENGSEIQTSYAFSSLGTKRARACAADIPEDKNKDNNCGPWTTIEVKVPAPDIVAGGIEESVIPGGEFSTITAIINNIGALPAVASFRNIFEYDKDSDHTTEVYGIGASSAGPLAAGGMATISASNDFPPGYWYMRACADKNSSIDAYGAIDEGPDHAGEANNCGPWTKVAATCPGPQYYDSAQDKCVLPPDCTDSEVYNYAAKTCVPKVECKNTEIYNAWTNSCLPQVDCTDPAQASKWNCQPGPGTWDDNNNGWDDSNFPSVSWTDGGWMDDEWVGGDWDGSSVIGRSWSGGTWKNGIWNGGTWTGGDYDGRGRGGSGSSGRGGSGTGSSGTGGDLKLGQKATPPSDAIVRYHEGVEHVFYRQIRKNTALQEKYGYDGKMNLDTFSWDIAHLLAQIYGYVDEDGREIRVSYPDIAAYELRLNGNRLTIYEYYAGVVVSIQNITTIFKTKAEYEYYYKK